MTMIPFDESLDVGKRLALLRIWQHSDREREEQLMALSGNHLLEFQQAVPISKVRRRMAMTLVTQPLSIPESVLKHLGVCLIREQFAQQFACLTKEECLRLRSTLSSFSCQRIYASLMTRLRRSRALDPSAKRASCYVGAKRGWARPSTETGFCSIPSPSLSRSATMSRSSVSKLPSAKTRRDLCCGGCCWNAGEPTWHATTKKFCSGNSCGIFSNAASNSW